MNHCLISFSLVKCLHNTCTSMGSYGSLSEDKDNAQGKVIFSNWCTIMTSSHKNPLRFNDPVCGNQCSLVEWCPHKVPWLWGVIFLCQTKQAIAHQLGSRRGDLIGQVGVMSSQPCDHFTYPTGIMWTIWKRTDTLLQLISMVIRLNDIKIITRK